MNTLLECRICDVLGTERDALCAPRPVASRRGSEVALEGKIAQMCEAVKARVRYRCERCERPSASAFYVCRALPLEP